METPLKIFLIIILTNLTSSQHIEIITLDNQILPFHLGQSKVIESKHTFIHYVEIKPLIKLLDNTINYFNIINNTFYNNNTTFKTQSAAYRNTLKDSLTQVHYLIKESQNKLNNLTPHLRSKRGLIDIIGKTSKFLFGTLDSDDAAKYENAFKILNHNQNSLNKQMQLQISISQNLIDNYNHTITTLNTNQILIKTKLKHFEHNVYKTFDDISAFLRAQNILNQVILNCQNLITFLDNLEDAITFAKLRTLHSSVISTSELKNILDNLTHLYGKNKIPQFTNILSYYQIADLRVSFANNTILFSIHMPILNSDIFNLYHIYPIPQSNLTIVPPNPYLLLSTQLHQYQEEDCLHIEDSRICENKLTPNDEDCIASMILNAVMKKCHLTKVQLEKPIKQLISNSHVLIIPTKQMRIKKTCNNVGFTILKQPSLVKIPQHCEVECDDFRFKNEKDSLQGEPFLLPEIKIEENREETVTRSLILHQVDLDEISKLQTRISEINPTSHIETHDIRHLYPSISSTVIIICALVFIIVKWKNHWQNFPKNRTPRNNEPAISSPASNIQESEAQNNTTILFSDLRREELY
jgi:hypothetical protein